MGGMKASDSQDETTSLLGRFDDTVKKPIGQSPDNPERTIVVGEPRVPGEPTAPVTAQRKLVGWLACYTWNKFGADFRLFEGQNTIGREATSHIRISEDSSISSKHGMILFRGEKFYFRDEMSTNSSSVNGVEVPPGNTVELRDGDELTLGKSVLYIRFANVKLP
jgi:hypothetical protein